MSDLFLLSYEILTTLYFHKTIFKVLKNYLFYYLFLKH